MNVEHQQARLRRQLEARGITDQRVLDVIAATRRDLFVPAEVKHLSYDDNALPIGRGQTISQPFIVALMTQELELTGTERVLEIGTGSGYQTAILAQLAREVVTVERIAELAQPAQGVLADLQFTNVEFRIGDGTLGCPDRAPYEGIVVTAAAPEIPQPLYDQLAEGGRMVIPVGNEYSQMLQKVVKQEPKPRVADLCACRFVKLVGEAAWPEEDSI